MAVKLADTLAPMGDFPVAEGKDVGVQIGEKSKSLQKAIEDGDLGGGGGSSLIDDEVIAEDSTWSSKKISEFGEALDKKVEDVDTKVGDLEELKTTEKGSVVGAVNEISDSLVDKADADKVVPLTYRTTVTDANDLPDGITTAYNLTNKPYAGFVTYETISLENNPAYRVQEATEVEGGKKYTRFKNNGTWSAWQELATMDKVAKRKTITVQTDSHGNIGFGVPVEKFVNAFIINQGELVRFLNVYTWANVAYGRVTDLSGNVITGTHTVTILYNE